MLFLFTIWLPFFRPNEKILLFLHTQNWHFHNKQIRNNAQVVLANLTIDLSM